jgi:hypothetical protein
MPIKLDEARAALIRGGDLVALAEAIGAIISSPSSSLDDIRLGLRHGGLIAEQATLELQRREAASPPLTDRSTNSLNRLTRRSS